MNNLNATRELLPVINALPQRFYISTSDSNEPQVVGLMTRDIPNHMLKQDGKMVLGSAVCKDGETGSFAYVIPTKGSVSNQASQRLLLTIKSNKIPTRNLTLDFYKDKSGPGALALHIADSLHGHLDVTEVPGNKVSLDVGPDTLEILNNGNASGGMVEFDFGSILNIAKTVVPIAAKAGMQIYQELNNKSESEDVEGIFSIIGSIAQVAVPIAAGLL